MFFIDKNNLKYLLLGSLFLATGGGLPLREHQKIFERLLKIKKKLPVKEIREFKKEDFLASIYGVGNPAQVKNNFKRLILKSLNFFKKYFQIKVKGLIPGEIGAEGIVFEAAAYLNIPVVDSDLVGGRAAPEIQMDVFSVYNKPLTPMIANAVNGKQMIFKGNFSAKEIENTLRKFFTQNQGIGVVAGYPIKTVDYQKIGAKNTLSKAIKIGEILRSSSQPLKELVRLLKGKIVVRENLKKVDLKGQEGFLIGWLAFKTKRIWVKNENMACFEKNKSIVKAPDLIVVLEAKSLKPIHNTQIKNFIGREVVIFACPGEKYWYTKKGKQIFSYTN